MLALAIIIVLMAAALLILLANKAPAAKMLAIVSLLVTSVLSCMLVATTMAGHTVTFAVGKLPWNLSLSVGPLEAFISLIFSVIGLLIVWASVTMIEHDVEIRLIPAYYALVCGLIATLCGVVFFNNVFNVFILIELSSFAAAGIVIIKNQPENLRAGLKYLTLSILGSGLVLMGIVILYSLTGALTLPEIGAGLKKVFDHNQGSVFFALVFITIGVAIKSALFPFHIWLPDAHGTAPSPSSAILSSLVLKAYIIFYIKILYTALGSTILNSPSIRPVLQVLLVFGVVAMIAGSLMAILQLDIKRMIAYSSVAQIGYIFMGIGLGNELGLTAAIFHILAHAVTKSGLFLQAGSIIEQTHNRRLDKMGGLGMQMPITMALFTICSLSMVGIPLFVGFNSKWNFAMAIMDSHQFWVMAALALSSLLNGLYYLPVVIRAFFGPEAKEKAAEKKSLERPLGALVPIILLACLVIGVALFSAPFMTMIRQGIAAL